MHRFFIRLLLIISVLSGYTQEVRANDSDLVVCNRAFKVVILGSSTAFGTGATNYDSSWAGKFTAYMKRKNILNEVYNLGIPGFTTYNNLRPIGYTPPPGRPSPVSGFCITDAMALDPDAIIINMPSNDAINDYSLVEQQANFEAAIAIADAANVPVWVTTTQPRNFLNPSQIANIQAMRTWILNRFGNKAVEFYETVANPDGSINAFYDFDAVHVNDFGHDLFYQRMKAETIIDSLCIRFDQQELVARAGNDQELILPLNNTTLDGSQSSSLNGTITTYLWTKVSGPSNGAITNPNIATTTVTNMVEGRYVFALTVTDNNNLTRSDTMNVVVSNRVLIDFGPDNSASPDAGGKYWNNVANTTVGVKLTNAVTVANTVSPLGFEVLTRIDGTFNPAGPGTNNGNTTGDIGDYPASATVDYAFSHPSTTTGQWKITGLDPLRQYRIKFWGSRTGITDARIIEIKRADQLTLWQEYNSTNNTSFDNAAVFIISNRSEMTFDIRTKDGSAFGYIGLIDITYSTAPNVGNIPPVARAGNDISVSLPNSSATLNGSASTDDDGEIVSYEWSKLTGPASFNIVSPNAATTAVNNLVFGSYTFELKVTDNEGAVSRDTVKVTVSSRILFDFGPTTTTGPDANGNYWNNIANGLAGVKVSDAVSTGNLPTGISLEIIERIDGTFNIAGPGTNTGNTVGDVQDYPASATTDFAFAHPSTTTGRWKIAGLDSTKEYNIKFWGNRSPVGDPRIIEIKREDETTWQSYDGANNSNYNNAAVFTFFGKTEMTFDIRVGGTSPFGYINVIDINISNPVLPCSPQITIATSSSLPICSGSRVRFTSSIVNGGDSPLYQWQRNGVNINGATADTLLITTLLNNDQISCVLTGNAVCTGSNVDFSNVITVPVLPIAPRVGNITGVQNICLFVGTNNPVTYSVSPVPNAQTYNWTVPAGATIVSGQGTTSIEVTFDQSFPSVDSIKVIAGPCTNSQPRTIAIFKTLPDIPGAISGPVSACEFIGQPTTATYSIQPVENATSYIWTVPDGTAIISGQGTTSVQVSFLNTFVTGSIKVASVSNCGSRAPRSLSVSGAKPGVPGTITGPSDACPFIGTSNFATYTIAPVANASSYQWTVPSNASIISGQGTTSIQVQFLTGYVSSNVRVRALSLCGNSGFRSLTVTATATAAPVSLAGPTNACPHIDSDIDVTYITQKVAGASSYVWTVPTGVTITGHPAGLGANDTVITVKFDGNFVSGTSIAVQAQSCGLSAARSIAINRSGVPASPGAITGPTNVCGFVANAQTVFYSISPVVNAGFYTWTVPSGATIVSHPAGTGVNDTIVGVVFSTLFSIGDITVMAENGCGNNGKVRSLTVRSLAPTSAPVISGPTDPCPWIGTPGATYTINKIANATGYTWTVPSVGATAFHPNPPGVDDTIIIVTYTSNFVSGSITARADAPCGSSSVRSLTLTRRLPSTPGLLTVSNLSACPVRQVSYSIPALPANATSATWTVPAGGTIISGQGTTSIVVEYASTAISGILSVVGTNNCGNSTSSRRLTINLPACPLPKEPLFSKSANSTESNISLAVQEMDITAMPNPSTHYFNVMVQSKDKHTSVFLRIYDLNGKMLEQRNGVMPGQTVQVGQTLRPGFYVAECIQGSQVKKVKLLKQ